MLFEGIDNRAFFPVNNNIDRKYEAICVCEVDGFCSINEVTCYKDKEKFWDEREGFSTRPRWNGNNE